jgi:hypothetical protein
VSFRLECTNSMYSMRSGKTKTMDMCIRSYRDENQADNDVITSIPSVWAYFFDPCKTFSSARNHYQCGHRRQGQLELLFSFRDKTSESRFWSKRPGMRDSPSGLAMRIDSGTAARRDMLHGWCLSADYRQGALPLTAIGMFLVLLKCVPDACSRNV